MKDFKLHSPSKRLGCMKNRIENIQQIGAGLLVLAGLTSGLVLPAYCRNERVSYQYTISSASARNNPAGVSGWTSNGPNEEIRSLVIDPNNRNTLYAASRGGVFKSTDAGETWSNKGPGDTHA